VAVTWATAADVMSALGLELADPADDDWLQTSTASANAWAFTKRAAAGFTDDPAVSPGDDVTQGVALYAAALYRSSRGGGDSAASFDAADYPTVEPTGGLATVLRLLHVNKAAAF
jgi:hypothetical protein